MELDVVTGGFAVDIELPAAPVEADVALAVIRGASGDSATVAVGSTTTGNAGSSASVTNSGSSSAAVLDFVIPRGDKGDDGDVGAAATVAVGTVSTGNAGSAASVVNSGTSAAAVLDFAIPRGDTGAAATVAVGSVTTGAAGSSASVVNAGTSGAATFDFTIPQGDKGDTGDVSLAGAQTLTNKDLTSGTNTFPSALVTLTGTQSLSNKTITGPVITGGSTIDGITVGISPFYIRDYNAQYHTRFSTAASAVNYAAIANSATGQPIQFAAGGTDTDVSINLIPKGAGTVQANYVPVVTTSGVQTLSNKTFGSTNTFTGVTFTNPKLGTVMDTNGNIAFAFIPVASAVNYLVTTNNATGGNPVLTATGSDTNVSMNLVTKGTGTVKANNVDVVTTTGTQSLSNKTLTSPTINSGKFDYINHSTLGMVLSLTGFPSPVNSWMISNSATGGPLQLSVSASSTDANVPIYMAAKGSGAVRFASNGADVARFSNPASAVNYLTVNGASTTNAPIIASAGSDANINVGIQSKGTVGGIFLGSDTGWALQVSTPASSVNYAKISGAATGSAVSVAATGSDTNIGVNLVPKGTGTVQANGVDVVTTTGTQSLSNKTLTSATLTTPKLNSIYDSNGNPMFGFVPITSAVNYLTLTNNAAGASPAISAAGSDTNLNLLLVSKGSGTVQANGNPVGVKVSVPATASSTGVVGQWAADSSWHYDCIATNTWVRSAATTW